MTLFPHSLKESRSFRAEPLKFSLKVSVEIQFPEETDGDNYLHACETDECTFLKVARLSKKTTTVTPNLFRDLKTA